MKKHIKVLALITLLTPLLSGCNQNKSIEDDTNKNNISKEEEILREKRKNLLESKIDFDSIKWNKQEVKEMDDNSNYFIQKDLRFNFKDVHATRNNIDLKSTGNQKILVIPVMFNNFKQYATEQVRDSIYKTFFGKEEETCFESLSTYYYKSSFQKLKIDGVVSEWFDCGLTTKELANTKRPESKVYDPTWNIVEEATKWYKEKYMSDLSEFDNDGDGYIDGLWLVYGAPNSHVYKRYSAAEQNIMWAYTFFDYDCSEKYRLTTKEVLPYHYCWASFDFMYRGYDNDLILKDIDGVLEENKKKPDAHTFIHETGHLLGLNDYYVTKPSIDAFGVVPVRNYGPSGQIDMMAGNIIDHNSYSKMALGWVSPYCLNTEVESGKSFDLTLKPASTSGECVIIPTQTGWNKTAFDEYLLIEYMTPEGLNKKDCENNYFGDGLHGFRKRGVRLSHIDARLMKFQISNYQNQYTTVPLTYVNDIFSSDDHTINTALAHSNTAAMSPYSLGKRFREYQMIDKENKINFDEDGQSRPIPGSSRINFAPRVALDKNLFFTGDSFKFEDFAEKQFPQRLTMNNGEKPAFDFQIKEITNEHCVITFTRK